MYVYVCNVCNVCMRIYFPFFIYLSGKGTGCKHCTHCTQSVLTASGADLRKFSDLHTRCTQGWKICTQLLLTV